MEKYELYYLDDLIANFCIDGENNIKYVPIINDKNDQFVLNIFKEEKYCPLKDFSFLYSRITNMKKYNLDILQYQGSNYIIKKIVN